MKTPLPTASTAIAVTNRRCGPTDGKPRRREHLLILGLQAGIWATGYPTSLALAGMTFSIVARSADGESWGVAVASKFLAVGSAVPAAVAGVGAIATQAWANVAYKGQALAHLDDGATARSPCSGCSRRTTGRDHRQVGIVDADGGSATHTGPACLRLGGRRHRRRVRDPGQHPRRRGGGRRRCAPPGRSRPTTRALRGGCWPRCRPATPRAATAGDASRRRCSSSSDGAGYDGGDDIAVDLRVDDHAEPLAELARLLDLNEWYLTPSDEDETGADRRRPAAPSSRSSPALENAASCSAAWVGAENLEMRVAATSLGRPADRRASPRGEA